MDMDKVFQEAAEKQRCQFRNMSHEELVEWCRSDFRATKALRRIQTGIVAGFIVREKPETYLDPYKESKDGYRLLADAAIILRSRGHSIPAPVMEFLLDVYLGIVTLPNRSRGAKAPAGMPFLTEGIRNELIFKHVSLISESTDLNVSRNDQSKVRKVEVPKETACGIVAEALGNLKEETVKKIYEEETRKRVQRMNDPDWLEALEEESRYFG